MSFTAAIDISTFVWCEQDFNTNRPYYYKLIELSPTIFEQVRSNRIPILLRSNLCELLMADFPYLYVNEIDPNYGWSALDFLTNTKWLSYDEGDSSDTITEPDIIKNHFNDEIKSECGFQNVHLILNDNPQHKFIAYHHFYKSDQNLIISNNENKVEIGTLCYQSEKEIVDFFENYKIKFEHNPKHDRVKARGIISPLSCYNERTGITDKAQKLLDEAFFYENDYYNFDTENNVYVRFIKTSERVFHGHDLSDDGNNIPNQVKKKFNK